MISKKADFHNRSIAEVKRLWHLYIFGQNPSNLEEELNELPENFLMIGTGRHEFYQTRNDFLSGMSRDQIEARGIQFELQDEWYEVQDISDTVCVVYGSIWAREKVLPEQTVFVDMQGSRFSIVCHDSEQGVKLTTVHHSMPYMDQGTDEYYPKTLASLAKELEHKAELDSMTNFYNRYYMERHVSLAMKNKEGYFLALDLDDFKNINDTKGHLMGDQVLIEFANILKNIASEDAVLGRMGGDEFAIWDSKIQSRKEVEERFSNLLTECEKISAKLDVQVTCSVGVVFCLREEDDFASVYYQADQALYHAKSLGKTQLYWSDNKE